MKVLIPTKQSKELFPFRINFTTQRVVLVERVLLVAERTRPFMYLSMALIVPYSIAMGR